MRMSVPIETPKAFSIRRLILAIGLRLARNSAGAVAGAYRGDARPTMGGAAPGAAEGPIYSVHSLRRFIRQMRRLNWSLPRISF
jgi:hypothetical protein